MSSGYYDDSSITTNISNLKGTINYTLVHQHTGNSTSGGGCYTKAVAKTRYCTGHVWGDWHKAGPDDARYERKDCIYCGAYMLHNGQVLGDSRINYIAYECNCGYEEGDYIRNTDDYSTITANEKISKATITY